MKTKNIIRILGDEDELQAMRDTVENDKSVFDFNAVVTEPTELANEVFEEEKINLKEEINRLSLYGAIDKYEWRKRYWGISDNYESVSWLSNSYVKMITKNGTPDNLLRVLSLKFDVIFQVLHSNSETAEILIIMHGNMLSIKPNSEEANASYHLIDDLKYTYKKWEANNPKVSKTKKVDMKLLLNYDSEFLSYARKIIDIKNNNLSQIPTLDI